MPQFLQQTVGGAIKKRPPTVSGRIRQSRKQREVGTIYFLYHKFLI